MPKLFIELPGFTEWIVERMADDAYARLQQSLADNPDLGRVMPGCGGIRKLRIPDPSRQQGKRGGARIIYLHIPEVDWLYFLDAYGKDEQDDLTPEEKKELKRLVDELKAEAAKAASGRPRTRK